MNKLRTSLLLPFIGATLLPLGANAQQTASASGSALASTSSSEAEEGLQEVIVTAERREESLQRAPVAISTVSGDAGHRGLRQQWTIGRRSRVQFRQRLHRPPRVGTHF
jgi:outer membrane receptor protein involved in Fe transport